MLQSRIRRGELDKEITFIQEIIVSSDSNEDKHGGWEPIDTDPTVYARLKQIAGGNTMIADRLTNVMITEAVIDYREDITTEMRFVYKTRHYQIASIIEHEMGRETYLVVTGELVDTEYYT